MSPIEMMLDGITWVPAGDRPDGPDNHDGVPFATHEGVLDLMGHKIRCYRLNTGQAVFNADDVNDFLGGSLGMNSSRTEE